MTDEIRKYPMSFPDAIQMVMEGHSISRREWDDSQCFGKIEGGFLMLHKPDGKFYQWIISDGDMLAKDWIYWTN